MTQIKDYIPPVVVNVFRRYKYRHRRLYSNYNEALKDCPDKLGYEEDDIVKVVFEKTKVFKEKLFKQEYLDVDQSTSHSLISIGLAANNRNINVIDIGGACGAHYFIFKKALGDRYKLSWKVVETPSMCKYAKAFQNEELKFYDHLQIAAESQEKIDLVFSSSTIQYLSDPRKALREIISLNAEFILLTRLSLTKGIKDIVSIQKTMLSSNGIGPMPEGFKDRKIKYPHTNMKEMDFIEILNHNYKIKLKFDDRTGVIPVNNEPITGYGLLLEKR